MIPTGLELRAPGGRTGEGASGGALARRDVDGRRQAWLRALELALPEVTVAPSVVAPGAGVHPQGEIAAGPAGVGAGGGATRAGGAARRALEGDPGRNARVTAAGDRPARGDREAPGPASVALRDAGARGLAAIGADAGRGGAVSEPARRERAERAPITALAPPVAKARSLSPFARGLAPAAPLPEAPLAEAPSAGPMRASPAGAEHASRADPLRWHLEWCDAGVRLWLGLDLGSAEELAVMPDRLLEQLRRWAAARGTRLLGFVCNGRTLWEDVTQPREPR